MKKSGTDYRLYLTGSFIRLLLLFVCVFLYLFMSIGLFVLGMIALPSSLLGAMGVLTVVTDLSGTALLLISGGILLVGAGMCVGAAVVCPAAFRVYKRTEKTARLKKEKASEEDNDGQNA